MQGNCIGVKKDFIIIDIKTCTMVLIMTVLPIGKI